MIFMKFHENHWIIVKNGKVAKIHIFQLKSWKINSPAKKAPRIIDKPWATVTFARLGARERKIAEFHILTKNPEF